MIIVADRLIGEDSTDARHKERKEIIKGYPE
jgi:hypothetical protein